MAYPAGYSPRGYGGQWGLQPTFAKRMRAFIAASGGKIGVGDSFRTVEASNAARKRKGSMVAKGGNSWHNYGLAVDLVFKKKGAQAWAHAYAARYGLYFPMDNEGWHIQPLEARGGGRGGKPIPRLGYKGSYNSARALPRNPYSAIVNSASAKYGIPRGLLDALLYFESSYNPRAVSSAGARGIAQFMPGTWSGAWNVHRKQSPNDPTYAIPAAAIYLKNLYKVHGSWTKVLSAYNSGRPNTYLSNPGVRGYVNKILPYLNSEEGFDRQVSNDIPDRQDIVLPPIQEPVVLRPRVLKDSVNEDDINSLVKLLGR